MQTLTARACELSTLIQALVTVLLGFSAFVSGIPDLGITVVGLVGISVLGQAFVSAGVSGVVSLFISTVVTGRHLSARPVNHHGGLQDSRVSYRGTGTSVLTAWPG